MAGGRTRTALVTGGTGGMGRVIAARLAADGFDVAVAYVGSIDLADATIGEIKGHGRHGAAFAADIADSGAVAALFDAAEDHFGHLDVVVHTAGINRPAALADLDLADFDEIHRVNVRGTFVVGQQASRRVRDGGSIVNVSSSMIPISRGGPVRLPDSSGGVTAFKFRDHDGHPLELLAFPQGHVPGEWRTASRTGSVPGFLGVDHTAIAVSDSAGSARFFGAVFGFSTGTSTENRGPEQADLDDVEDVHVSVTRLAPDLPAPRLELLHYHAGTRRPIPRDIASNDIVATHSAVRVPSLDATAAALARRGTPLTDDDLMLLRGGIRAALVAGPDGHRFLVEEQTAAQSSSALTSCSPSARTKSSTPYR